MSSGSVGEIALSTPEKTGLSLLMSKEEITMATKSSPCKPCKTPPRGPKTVPVKPHRRRPPRRCN
jgi:hypothetical protein